MKSINIVWLICRSSPHQLLVREIEGEPTISLANTWWRIRATIPLPLAI